MNLRTTSVTCLMSLALLLGACSDDGGCVDRGTCTGVVTDIESAGIGQIESFTLKSGDETVEVLIDQDREYGFDLGHLHEHLTTSEPVSVDLEERDGKQYATSVEDA